jgi:hypothetical protein
LRFLEATHTSVGMSNPIAYLAVDAAAFSLAGVVRGVTGLALPDWHFSGRTWRSEVFGEH